MVEENGNCGIFIFPIKRFNLAEYNIISLLLFKVKKTTIIVVFFYLDSLSDLRIASL